jgi:hypothetical protein
VSFLCPVEFVSSASSSSTSVMATLTALGLGAVAAGLAGRHFLKRGARVAGDQWAKGGFKAKMDRAEAIEILGLKFVSLPRSMRLG